MIDKSIRALTPSRHQLFVHLLSEHRVLLLEAILDNREGLRGLEGVAVAVRHRQSDGGVAGSALGTDPEGANLVDAFDVADLRVVGVHELHSLSRHRVGESDVAAVLRVRPDDLGTVLTVHEQVLRELHDLTVRRLICRRRLVGRAPGICLGLGGGIRPRLAVRRGVEAQFELVPDLGSLRPHLGATAELEPQHSPGERGSGSR